ncbi:MAG TPA: methyltransferase domain-containing protein [Thermoplasmata archaeon]|nr:methyltransferase domain-containing protein [Thermoplasmata archaeon]
MQPERVVLLEPSGRKHLVVLDQETINLPRIGVVRAETLRALIGRRWRIGGRAFLVLTPSVRDMVGTIRRKAQIIGPKDAPSIVWNCDLKAGDSVVEVGAGSGALTIALAHAVGPNGQVVTYDLLGETLEVVRRNLADAGFATRVDLKRRDARAGIDERDVDAVVVDIPDPWAVVDAATRSLRPCGHLGSYSPNVEQVSRTVQALRDRRFVEVRTIEIIEREIMAQETGTHPSFAPLGHTGYLTFARKVLDTF